MLYNLPNGKTVELTIEQFLNMTDEDEQYLIAHGHGEEMNYPWRQSILERPDSEKDEDFIDELPDIPLDDKLMDEDFIESD